MYGPSGFAALMGQTRESWFGLRASQREAMQRQEAARQAGLTSITEVTNALIQVHGLGAAIQANDDRSLRRMQDMAITLGSAPLLVRSPAQVQALYEDWKKTNRGKVVPYGSVLLEYASRLAAEGRLVDGTVVGKPNAGGNGAGGKRGERSGKRGDASLPDGEWTERARKRDAEHRARAEMHPMQIGDIDF